VKRRTPVAEGLRAALITAEREAIAASPWRLHATTYSNRPGSMLAQLEAGQSVQVPGYRLHGLVPGVSGCEWVRIEPDGTPTRIDRPGAP